MSLKSIAGGLIKGAINMIPIAGPAIAGAIGGGSGGRPSPVMPSPAVPQPYGGFAGVGGSVALGPIAVSGQVGKTTTYSAQGTFSPGSAGACPRGYHLNKHALPASRRHGAVPARTICVRNRHLNALNGRAAGRALRRLKRADKMTRKIHSLFHRPSRAKAKGRK